MNITDLTNPSEASRMVDVAGEAVRGETLDTRLEQNFLDGTLESAIRVIAQGLCFVESAVLEEAANRIAAAAGTPKTASIDVLRERERCAAIADRVASECEQNECDADLDDELSANWAFGGKIEAQRIGKIIREG